MGGGPGKRQAKAEASPSERAGRTSADADEIARFERLAQSWWDPQGDFAPLHRFNPTRLAFIRAQIDRHFGRSSRDVRPFAGLSLLDIGCGGGLVAEPMARLGARVCGIDAGATNIAVAARHAGRSGLAIEYLQATPEALADQGRCFDVVLNLEVVEHVAEPAAFIADAARLVAPGGLMIVATLNRTAKAFALAVVGAEYLLRWLPRGTHDWRKFLKPSELARMVRAGGLELNELAGLAYDPLKGSWSLGRDLAVNYMLSAAKPILSSAIQESPVQKS